MQFFIDGQKYQRCGKMTWTDKHVYRLMLIAIIEHKMNHLITPKQMKKILKDYKKQHGLV